MKCNNCGKKNKKGTDFCVYCGSKIDKSATEKPDIKYKSVKCQNCGKKNKMPVSFCLFCGKPIAIDENNATIQNNHKFHPVIAVVSFVLCLAIAAGVILATGVFRISNGVQSVPGRIEFKEFSDDDVDFENNELYVKNQLLITADEQYSYDDIKRIVSEYDGEIVGCIEFTNDYQVEFEEKSYDELITLISNIDSNLTNSDIGLHYVFWALFEESDSEKYNYGKWWRENIKLNDLEKEEFEYQPVNVGVYDTLFQTSNNDLSYLFENGEIINNDETLINILKDSKPTHGTDVLGFLAAKKNNNFGVDGVANNVNAFVYAAMKGDNNNYGEDTIYAASTVMQQKYIFTQFIRRGVKVINLSHGFDELCVACELNIELAREMSSRLTKWWEDFFIKLLKFEFIIVKSAGNGNGYEWIDCEPSKEHPFGVKAYSEEDGNREDLSFHDLKVTADFDSLSAISNPKISQRIIVVGSSDIDNTRATHSNSGKRVDIYAPGVFMQTLYDTSIAGYGTSYAAPLVAGTAALMWGVNPNLKAEDIKLLLISSATQPIEGENYQVLSDSGSIIMMNKSLLDSHQAVILARNYSTTQLKSNDNGTVIGFVRIFEYFKPEYNIGKCTLSIYEATGFDITDGPKEELYKEVSTGESGDFCFELPPGYYVVSAESEDGLYGMDHQFAFVVEKGEITYISELNLRKKTDIDLEQDIITTEWDLKWVYSDDIQQYVDPKKINIGEPYWGSVKDVDTHLYLNNNKTFETSFGVKSIKGTFYVLDGRIFLDYDIYSINTDKPIRTGVYGVIHFENIEFNNSGFETNALEFEAFDHLNYYVKENEAIETDLSGGYEVDTDKLYSSDLIQKVGDDVYYCSSDGAPEYLALPTLDLSDVKPEYKKLPIDVEYGVQSFIIYGDSIFYICDYPNGHYNDSAGTYGKLYKCDLQGENQELIADYVDNLLFHITDYNLEYSARQSGQKTKIYHYDIRNKQIVDETENSAIGDFNSGCIFRFEKSQGHMELDGGYYYFEAVRSSGTEPNRIDGKLANIIFYREDIKTGQVDRVGYTFSQSGGW